MTTANEILKNNASHQDNPGFPDGEITEFHPEGAYWADPSNHELSKCDIDLLETMARYLRDAVNGDLDISGAVETEVFRKDTDESSYIARVVLAVGGPYIAITFDSDEAHAEIVGYWSGTAFRIREYGDELAEICQELAE